MKLIPGFSGRYFADPSGQIIRADGRVLRQWPKKPKGYMVINLSGPMGKKKYRVSRLIALAYIDNPGGKKTVNHKDFDKANNRIENLEWATIQENIAHAHAAGRFGGGRPKKRSA